jgi:hypothetical protein
MKFVLDKPEDSTTASVEVAWDGYLVLKLDGETVLSITPDGLLRKYPLEGTHLPLKLNEWNRIKEVFYEAI